MEVLLVLEHNHVASRWLSSSSANSRWTFPLKFLMYMASNPWLSSCSVEEYFYQIMVGIVKGKHSHSNNWVWLLSLLSFLCNIQQISTLSDSKLQFGRNSDVLWCIDFAPWKIRVCSLFLVHFRESTSATSIWETASLVCHCLDSCRPIHETVESEVQRCTIWWS